MNETEIKNAFVTSSSKSQVCDLLKLHKNGAGFKKINELITQYNIDTSHFNKGDFNRRYEQVTKTCPVCGTEFKTRAGSPREKTTCSYSCSNVFFRSGTDNPNWKDSSYRSTCFHYHEKKCIICGEDKIIDVHHFDLDKTNNNPDNLIPMCPTHHMYYHSRYKDEVEQQIIDYRNTFLIT